jgi:hypothetical protein
MEEKMYSKREVEKLLALEQNYWAYEGWNYEEAKKKLEPGIDPLTVLRSALSGMNRDLTEMSKYPECFKESKRATLRAIIGDLEIILDKEGASKKEQNGNRRS